MSMKNIVTAAVAATLALSSVSSFAQAYDKRGKVIVIQQQDSRHDNRRDDHKDDRHDNRRNDRHDNHSKYQRNDRRDNRDEPQARYYYNARGPEFTRGHAIPRDLRSRQYVVVDYRQHRLSPPPRGQQWVQVGADYVLVAIATGIIANIILSR